MSTRAGNHAASMEELERERWHAVRTNLITLEMAAALELLNDTIAELV